MAAADGARGHARHHSADGGHMELDPVRPLDPAISGRIGSRVAVGIGALTAVEVARGAVPASTPVIVVVALVLSSGIAGLALDWHAVTRRPRGALLPYLWNALGLAGVAAFEAFAGPQAPDRYLLVFGLAVVASGASYPPAGQRAMYAAAMAAAVVGRWAATGGVVAAEVVRDLGLLAVLAYVTTRITGHLRSVVESSRRSRGEAERQAELVEAVDSLAELDPHRTMSALTDAVAGLGFDLVTLGEVREGRLIPHATRGLSADLIGPIPADRGISGEALRTGRTAVADHYPSYGDAVPGRGVVGSALAVPIVSDDGIEGCLAAARLRPGPFEPQILEAVELLAAHAGRALVAARRYEAERLTVEELAELDRMKSDFLAGVPDDLRAPLTVVRGLGETLIANRHGGADREQLLDVLVANADRLGEMIDSLTDVSRGESGQATRPPPAPRPEGAARTARVDGARR